MYFPIMSICGRKQPRQFQHKNLRGLRSADICKYLGVTPAEFFDNSNGHPAQYHELISDIDALNEKSRQNILAIIKELKRYCNPNYTRNYHLQTYVLYVMVALILHIAKPRRFTSLRKLLRKVCRCGKHTVR